MIDSVNLEISDILKGHKNEWIVNRLKCSTLDSRKNSYRLQKKPMGIFDVMSYDEYVNLNKDKFHSEYRGHTDVGSWSYPFLYRIVEKQNKVMFNFSVPKALYGNNVLMFLNYDFIGKGEDVLRDVDAQADLVYYKLRLAIKKIFIYVLGIDGEQWNSLEFDLRLTRIDFCLNKVFDSRDNCIKMLDYLKNIRKENSRLYSKNSMTKYDTSIYYVSENYTCKVYHKGTEFIKNDLQELIKKKTPQHLIDKLKDISERTLRFEMEFRNGYMSKVFRSKLYRRNSQKYNSLKFYAKLADTDYLKVAFDSITGEINLDWAKEKRLNIYNYVKNDLLHREVKAMLQNKIDIIRLNHDYNGLFKLRNAIDKYKELYDKYYTQAISIKFKLRQDQLQECIDGELDGKPEPVGLFNSQLFKEMYYIFKEYLKEYEVTEFVPLYNGEDIRKYLESRMKQLGIKGRASNLIHIYMLLSSGKTYDDIKKMKIYPERTLNYNKQKLKLIGIDKRSQNKENINIAPMLNSYFDEIFLKNYDYNICFRKILVYS